MSTTTFSAVGLRKARYFIAPGLILGLFVLVVWYGAAHSEVSSDGGQPAKAVPGHFSARVPH